MLFGCNCATRFFKNRIDAETIAKIGGELYGVVPFVLKRHYQNRRSVFFELPKNVPDTETAGDAEQHRFAKRLASVRRFDAETGENIFDRGGFRMLAAEEFVGVDDHRISPLKRRLIKFKQFFFCHGLRIEFPRPLTRRGCDQFRQFGFFNIAFAQSMRQSGGCF